MHAVQIIAPGQTQFVDIPKPQLKPRHALIRTKCLSLCGSDIFFLHHFPPSSYPLAPGTTGHEMVGMVVAVDDPLGQIRGGDMALVIAPEQTAMAEYYLAPVENVLVLPSGKPIEHLLQAQQLGTVIYACKQLPSVVDKNVAVIGQGSAGLWFDFMLRRMGARRVMTIDLLAHRLKAGQLYGATHTVDNSLVEPATAVAEITHGDMADVVVEAAGEVETINMAIDLARPQGFLLYFGVPRQPVMPIKFAHFFDKCLLAKGNVHAYREPGHTSTRLALDLIASGVIDVAPILTHRFPFAQVPDAYELQRTRHEGAIKIIIDMP